MGESHRISVHQALGSGSVADVLLWKKWSGGVVLLVSSTAMWFLFEWAGYNILSFVSNVLLLLIVILFFWAKSASLLNRPLPLLPDLEVSEESVVKAAESIRVHINQGLAVAREITVGRNVKVLLQVVFGLWVISYVGSFFNFLTLLYIELGDNDLEEVASNCKELQELRMYASRSALFPIGNLPSEKGLISISMGCPKLNSLQYFCFKMTNAALATVATNCPNLSRFSLHIIHSRIPYYVTTQPFDEGFGAIVRSCKKLKYLSLSGLLTDQVFLYMGMYAEQLETLIVEFSGESDTGILYLLNGCSKLRKLVIMNSPIGDAALLAAADKYKRLQFFWMASCNVTLEGCKALTKKVSKLNIEIIKDGPLLGKAELKKMYKIYMYRSLDGPRNDAPGYVCTLDEHY